MISRVTQVNCLFFLFDFTLILPGVVVQFQHRFFIPLALIGGFGVPVLLSWLLWDDLWGGLLYGGFVARIVIWHSIFSINSLAHYVGTQEYSLKNTSRGNLFLAFLTNGEGKRLELSSD